MSSDAKTHIDHSTAFFVYGTLRPGGFYWPEISSFVRETTPATISGWTLWHLPEGYPAIIAGAGVVHGELLWIENTNREEATALMDAIEDYCPDRSNSLYHRISTSVRIAGAKNAVEQKAYFYIYSPQREHHLRTHGIYLAHGDWYRYAIEANLDRCFTHHR